MKKRQNGGRTSQKPAKAGNSTLSAEASPQCESNKCNACAFKRRLSLFYKQTSATNVARFSPNRSILKFHARLCSLKSSVRKQKLIFLFSRRKLINKYDFAHGNSRRFSIVYSSYAHGQLL